MSTATIDANAAVQVPAGAAMLRRFVWKEYRMLRGLWLAVLGMGALAQWALSELMSPSADDAAVLLSTGLAAAVLYAVGAAATAFSVEHEEETYSFLTGLPATWRPLFAGKLLVAFISAFSLAAALVIVGGLLCDRQPGLNDATVPLGMLGVAIIEGIAWGTLFSLLVKRPLAAVILALVVGAVVVNITVSTASSYAVGSTNPQAYLEAIPQRLTIVGIVLACAVATGWRWLEGAPRGSGAASLRITTLYGPWKRLLASFDLMANVAVRGARRRMLAHLVWHSWRESWTLLPMPLVVAATLWLCVAALTAFVKPDAETGMLISVATLMFVPALYGALVFSADQRRGSYRFLAEHAARPRYIWLARHIVWLGTLIVASIAFLAIAAAVTAAVVGHESREALSEYVRWGHLQYGDASSMTYDLAQRVTFINQASSLAWLGAFAAYAVGQICSMLMRSEILAAFLAVVLSVVLSAWIAVLFAWQLSGWLFLLPIGVGFMLATWLRAPAWITQRNSWRNWVFPALAAAAPFAIVAVSLPLVRLSQVSNVTTEVYGEKLQWVAVDEAVHEEVQYYLAGDTPEARETAEMYIRAAARAGRPIDDALAPWEKAEYAADGFPGGIDEAKIPRDELKAYRAAKERQSAAIRETLGAAVNLAIEASGRRMCRFDFDPSITVPAGENTPRMEHLPHSLFVRLNDLLLQMLVADELPELVETVDRYVAALRMSGHLRADQPSVVVIEQLQMEQEVLKWIGEWATDDGQSKELLRNALERLTTELLELPELQGTLIADHLLVRKVLEDKEPPLVLALWPDSATSHLAYLANQLPWERERALRALNGITLQNIRDASTFTDHVSSPRLYNPHILHLRRWLRPRERWYGMSESWQITDPAAATSYLMRFEYQARAQIHELYREYADNAVCRRAALLQIALAAYRAEHGEYPPRLADLAPEYLDAVPIDPYSGQFFQYEPKGVDSPLQRQYRGNYTRIEPNTPFLWSVGAGNVRMMRSTVRHFEDDETDASDERVEVRKDVYVLASQEQLWWNETEFVFPLSK